MRIIIFFGYLILLCACQTVETVTDKIPYIGEEPPVRYSENPQVGIPGNRQYKKMTKTRMEEEAELQSNAGSMWQMDGQSSYLFIQNKTRREGDVLNVKLEGAAQKQVETKVKVIKKLLKQIEDEEKASRGQQLAEADQKDGTRAPAAAPKAAEAKEKEDDKADLSDIQLIPTRIVEKLPDGNYRIKGAQPFMIDKREYKVIVIGMIRPEDFNDEGVMSSKLLDPQFDVVSIRRKTNDSQKM
jgi:flagellar L-ring protein precursor FlgH